MHLGPIKAAHDTCVSDAQLTLLDLDKIQTKKKKNDKFEENDMRMEGKEKSFFAQVRLIP